MTRVLLLLIFMLGMGAVLAPLATLRVGFFIRYFYANWLAGCLRGATRAGGCQPGGRKAFADQQSPGVHAVCSSPGLRFMGGKKANGKCGRDVCTRPHRRITAWKGGATTRHARVFYGARLSND